MKRFLLLLPLLCLAAQNRNNPYHYSNKASSLSVNAGPGSVAVAGNPGVLNGTASFTPDRVIWEKSSGPGTVTFSSTSALSTTATFGAVGDYTLKLTAFSGYSYNEDFINVRFDPGSQVNTAPTLGGIIGTASFPNMDEDANTGDLPFSISDAQTAATALIVTVTSSNPTLFPSGAMILGGSGGSRTLRLVPVANLSGTATVTLTVADPDGLSTSSSYSIVVRSINDPPTVAAIGPQSTPEDIPKTNIVVTVGDVETTQLNVTATSSNQGLVPASGIALGGSGTSRSLTLTPALNQFGQTVITVSVNDGSSTTTTQFTLTVSSQNDAPSMTSIQNLQTVNGVAIASTFMIGDVEDGTTLTLARFTSDASIIPVANIVLSGSGANRTVTLTPISAGVATVRIDVIDSGALSASRSFTLTVTAAAPVNTPPTISDVPNQSVIRNGNGLVDFIIGDAETEDTGLQISVTSSNPSLINTNTPALPPNGLVTKFYVSTTGNDSWDGSTASFVSGTTGPFATIDRARTAVQTIKAANQFPSTGCGIAIRGGLYFLTTSLNFTAADNGLSATAPVVYYAYQGEVVRIAGGKEATGWLNVATRLPELNTTQEANIKTANAGILGITLAAPVQFGQLNGDQPVVEPFLVEGGVPSILARWPNYNDNHADGGTEYSLFTTPMSSTSFTYPGGSSGRPNIGNQGGAWVEPVANIWTAGFYGEQYNFSRKKVSTINTGSQLVTLASVPPYPPDPAGSRRFYWVNVLSELDQPGEYYMDLSSNLIYYWPRAAIGSNNRVTVSQLTTQIAIFNGVSDLRFEGVNFEASRGRGVFVNHCTRVEIRNCTVKGTGQEGFVLAGTSTFSGMKGGFLSGTGGNGATIGGGNRNSLTHSSNYVDHVKIHNTGRFHNTYDASAIFLNGVGGRVSHCEITNIPGAAIYGYRHNNYLIEYNILSNICTHVADYGAYYQGRSPTERGHVIRYNLFKRISMANGANDNSRVHSIYMDDGGSQVNVYGNIFDFIDNAILSRGGRDNLYSNNVLGEITSPSNWQRAWFQTVTPPSGTWQTELALVPYTTAPWTTHYPGFNNVLNDQPGEPKGVKLNRNIKFGSVGAFTAFEGSSASWTQQIDNFTSGDPLFVNYSGGNYDLQPSSPVWDLGWTDIPQEQMGPQAVANTPIETGGGSGTPGLLLGGTGANRTLTMTPFPDQVGTATIVLQVKDDGNLTASDAFNLTVSTTVNQPPAMTGVPSARTTNEDQETIVNITVGDPETPAANLILTAASSNPALIPVSSIVFSGGGANRVATLKGLTNQNGSSTISFSLGDGTTTTVQAMALTVTSVNDPAQWNTTVGNRTTALNTPVVVSVAYSDVETASASLIRTGTSDNTSLLPNANIVFAAGSSPQNMTLTPATGQSGSATVTAVVSDGAAGGSSSQQFILTVTPSGGRTFYVSPTGASGNSGAANSPWRIQDVTSAATKALINGDTVFYMPGTYTGHFDYSGVASGQIIHKGLNRPYTSQAAILDRAAEGPNTSSTVAFTGSGVWLWGLEIINSGQRSGDEDDRGGGVDGRVGGQNNKVINCLIHDGGTGIGVQDDDDSDIGTWEFNGNISYFAGWMGSHGHNFYCQIRHPSSTMLFKDNISHNAHAQGFQFSGTETRIFRNATARRNVFWNNGFPSGSFTRNMLFGFGNDLRDIIVEENYFWVENGDGVGLAMAFPSDNPDTIGDAFNTNGLVRNNYIVGQYHWSRWVNLISTNNTLIASARPPMHHFTTAPDSSNVENFNFLFGTSTPYLLNSSSLSLSGWQAATVYGDNDVATNTLPTANRIFIHQNDYDPKEANIIVYNWQNLSTVQVNLTSILSANDPYEIRYSGNPKVVHSNGVALSPNQISVPMTGFTMASPVGPDTLPARASTIQFAAFRLVKLN